MSGTTHAHQHADPEPHPHARPEEAPRTHEPQQPEQPERRHNYSRWYLPVAAKFLLSALFAACWTGAAVWISLPWITQGALTVHGTDNVTAIGGWPDAIGEDIVVT